MGESKSETKPVRYHLEIYEPHSERDVLVSFSAGGPFMAMAVGDVIDTRGWGLGGVPERIIVKEVEHLVWQADTHVSHKIMVLTTPAKE